MCAGSKEVPVAKCGSRTSRPRKGSVGYPYKDIDVENLIPQESDRAMQDMTCSRKGRDSSRG